MPPTFTPVSPLTVPVIALGPAVQRGPFRYAPRCPDELALHLTGHNDSPFPAAGLVVAVLNGVQVGRLDYHRNPDGGVSLDYIETDLRGRDVADAMLDLLRATHPGPVDTEEFSDTGRAWADRYEQTRGCRIATFDEDWA